MPYPPLQYSALISYNIQDKGYTVAYAEWYDYDLNILRFDGRVAALGRTDIINFDKAEHYQFNKNSGVSAQCKLWSTVNIDSAAGDYYSLADFIGLDEYNPKTYLGVDSSARGIKANTWLSKHVTNHTLSPTSYTSENAEITYFYSYNSILGARNIPIRIITKGTLNTYILDSNTNSYVLDNSYQFYHNMDIIEFISSPQPSSVFAIRPNIDCVTIDPPTVTLPSVSAVTPVNMSAPPALPTFPKKFVTYLEAKLSDNSNTVSSAKWTMDFQNKYERIDEYNPELLETVTTIYKYQQGTDGFLYKYLSSEKTCTSGILSETGKNPNTSPFARVRAGSIPNLFANKFPEGLTYQGRVNNFRGLIADTWVSNTTVRTRSGITYTYNTTIYFSVDGWQFPGRALSSGKVPFRIVNTGTYKSTLQPTPTAYSDIWDFYLFVDTIADESVFDEKLLGCPDAPTILQDLIDQSLKNGKAAGAVIGVILGLGLVIAAGYFVYIRFIKPKKFLTNDTELAGRDSLTALEDM